MSSDDDDFGNFSDASFEANLGEDNDEATTMESCINEIFGDETFQATTDSSTNLTDLLKEERPRVIYEQLVDNQYVLPPFIWNSSNIRTTMLHILRIPDQPKKVTRRDSTILDDSLFNQLCQMIENDVENNNNHSNILRDYFKMHYTSPLVPTSLEQEDHNDQELNIPKLTVLDFNHMDSKFIQDYHDKLCHAIDYLVLQLKELNKTQQDLIHDKTTYENVVTNLSGHTQRLQRGQIALYNKKKQQQQRWSRFSWAGH